MVRICACGDEDGYVCSARREGATSLISDVQKIITNQDVLSNRSLSVKESPASMEDEQFNSSCPNGDDSLVGANGNVHVNALMSLTGTNMLRCPKCFNHGHTSHVVCLERKNYKSAQCSVQMAGVLRRAKELTKSLLSSTYRCIQYGCTAMLCYNKKLHDHERMYLYEHCPCPHINCDHITTYKSLLVHFESSHSQCSNQFTFNSTIFIPLLNAPKYVFLQERDTGAFFVLHNSIGSTENYFTLHCVAPTLSKGFTFVLSARYARRSEKIQSVAANIPGKIPDHVALANSLAVRKYCTCTLELTICNHNV